MLHTSVTYFNRILLYDKQCDQKLLIRAIKLHHRGVVPTMALVLVVYPQLGCV